MIIGGVEVGIVHGIDVLNDKRKSLSKVLIRLGPDLLVIADDVDDHFVADWLKGGPFQFFTDLIREHHTRAPAVHSKDVIRLRPHVNQVARHSHRLAPSELLKFQAQIDIDNLIQIRLSTRLRRSQMTRLKRKR